MERQHQYKPGITAQVGNLREGRVDAPPQVEGAGAGILRAAMALGGEVMNVVAKDYAREMRARIDEAVIRTNEEFEKWKTEYISTHRGADALAAQKDFTDKYAELSRQTMTSFGGNANEIYAKSLERRLVLENLHAVKSGGAYQVQQEGDWQNSILAAQKSALQRAIDENPYDVDWLHVKANEYLQTYQSFFAGKGKDIGAERDAVQSMLANGRMQSLLARKGYEGAQRLLGGGYGGKKIGLALAGEESGADKMLAIGYDPNGGTSYGTWQLSSRQGSMGEWLNLLASKGEKGAQIAREIREAGPLNSGSKNGAAVEAYKKHARENAELFEETQREYLLKSHYGPALAQLPASQRAMIEGNGALQEMLFSTAVQHGGGGAAKILKRAWQEGMSEADLVRAVYAGRANPGNFRSTPGDMARTITQGRFPRERDKVLAMLNGDGNGGLTSVEKMRYQTQIDAGREKQLKEAQAIFVAETSQRIAQEAGQLPNDMREYAIQLEAEKIEDPQVRAAVVKYAKENIKQAAEMEKAKEAAQAYVLIEAGRKSGESVSEFIIRVNRANIGEEAKKLAIDGFEGKLEDNEITQTALNSLLVRIDVSERKGEPMSPDNIYEFAKNNRLTLDQTKTALKYLEAGGNLFGLKISDVQNAYIYLQGGLGKMIEKKDVPAWVFPAALQELKRMDYAGKKLDDKTLRGIIANLLVMGTMPGWFGTSSNVERGKAMAEGKLDQWKQGELPKMRGERDEYPY